MFHVKAAQYLIVVAVVALFGFFAIPSIVKYSSNLGYGETPRKVYIDLFGSSAVNLNTNYASTTATFLSQYMNTLSLNVSYTTVSTSTRAEILVEVSNDGGTTFYPLTYDVDGTTSTLSYIEYSSGVIGRPIVFPMNSTVSTTKTYLGSITIPNIIADYVKVSARATSAATSTIAIRAVTSDQ